ncbi:isoamyl alcohol oxidase, partial [Metarhizium majus ARSEF 297]
MKLFWYSPLALLSALPWTWATSPDCKCTPDQACWPTEKEWARFNKTINGKLIKTSPVMLPCFIGPHANNATCQYLLKEGFYDPKFQAENPVGYDYPANEACPPPASAFTLPASYCQLGNSPTYAINATSEAIISKGIKFAKEKNLRVVIKSTGHDFLQRSKGFFGLSIWLYHFRDGFYFNNHNPEADHGSSWNGSTLTIRGGYAWSDLYPYAKEKGVIAVGGNQNGPCSTGGWTQGGGHSPVTRNFGMGADQVVSARVVLASGKVVKASLHENPDLFFAIRGGGPGTYGVVTELIVKTYPTRNVNLFFVELLGQGDEKAHIFLDAMTTVYSALPELSKSGFGGYGYWSTYGTGGFRGYKYTNIWVQAFTILDKSPQEAKRLFQPFQDKLTQHNFSTSGFVLNVTHSTYPTYAAYFASKVYTGAVVGGISALSSRLLDTAALTGKRGDLRQAMNVMAGKPGEPIGHTLVHHGLESTPGQQLAGSAVQPGWYRSIMLDIYEIGVTGFSVAENAAAFAHIREKVYPVYEKLSPTTGTYMNEADFGDAQWQKNFYGIHYDKLSKIKTRYDPDSLFYCTTCVGSEAWAVKENGSLCRS